MTFGNNYSEIFIGVPLTQKLKKLNQPTHLKIDFNNSVVLFEQIQTLNQSDIINYMTHLSKEEMIEVNKRLKISLGIWGDVNDS